MRPRTAACSAFEVTAYFVKAADRAGAAWMAVAHSPGAFTGASAQVVEFGATWRICWGVIVTSFGLQGDARARVPRDRKRGSAKNLIIKSLNVLIGLGLENERSTLSRRLLVV
jgi:hypothetical protein